ncbi:hypothetical protein [Modicisalibacter radicis]|uniref:hypothetical protein n=1 Tax=Halomonas sp. EAR18 TaxID=2518972 RepID=UPI001B34EFE2|nr:hypothetical protein [Halomonas sp. EAR18]
MPQRPTQTLLAMTIAALLAPAVGQAESARSDEPARPSGQPSNELAQMPVGHIIEREILPKLDFYFDKLLDEGEDITLDGTEAFSGKDKFLPGKIAIGLSYLLLNTPQDDPRFERYLEGYRRIADMTVDDRNETWGIYYYVSALNRLKDAGLLERAISDETLAKLKEKTDWRQFVDTDDMSLIDLPTNYYGVAFSIARLRHLLGWEDASGSERLLDKMMDHYREYSGEYGFSDETNGQGRFDRYSVLLIGEICQRFIETGMQVTPQMKEWLRNSVEVILPRLNEEGYGFSYGRSIGAYGDTAFLEVLSAAAYLDVLSDEEERMAYAFAARATARYANFWYDEEMNSVNLWDNGRTTDDYRGKHRILGENLSLSHQLIYTANLWKEIGYRGQAPSPEFPAWLETLPDTTLTWFARGDYDRALVTYRDRGHVISLPLINGGKSQHMHTPYYPIPFASGMLEGTPDESYPQLLPRITLEDDSQLIPAAFIRDIETRQSGDTYTVSYHQDELDRLGESEPIKDDRLAVDTRYRLSPGKITRTDTYRPSEPLDIRDIRLEFASFSDDASLDGKHAHFAQGAVSDFRVEGLEQCQATRVDGEPPYQTPVGPLITRIACESGAHEVDGPFTIQWTLEYD